MGKVKRGPAGENHGPFEFMGQFTYVAPPRLRKQAGVAGGSNCQPGHPVAGGDSREQVAGERQEVGSAAFP